MKRFNPRNHEILSDDIEIRCEEILFHRKGLLMNRRSSDTSRDFSAVKVNVRFICYRQCYVFHETVHVELSLAQEVYKYKV